jgi:hypothetical protein
MSFINLIWFGALAGDTVEIEPEGIDTLSDTLE